MNQKENTSANLILLMLHSTENLVEMSVEYSLIKSLSVWITGIVIGMNLVDQYDACCMTLSSVMKGNCYMFLLQRRTRCRHINER